jgi:hypothetical protein
MNSFKAVPAPPSLQPARRHRGMHNAACEPVDDTLDYHSTLVCQGAEPSEINVGKSLIGPPS